MHVVVDGRRLENVVGFDLEIQPINVSTMGSLPRFIDGPRTARVRYAHGGEEAMSGHDVVTREDGFYVYIDTVSPEREAELEAARLSKIQKDQQDKLAAALREAQGIWDRQSAPLLATYLD